jgi:hypothetical protein
MNSLDTTSNKMIRTHLTNRAEDLNRRFSVVSLAVKQQLIVTQPNPVVGDSFEIRALVSRLAGGAKNAPLVCTLQTKARSVVTRRDEAPANQNQHRQRKSFHVPTMMPNRSAVK